MHPNLTRLTPTSVACVPKSSPLDPLPTLELPGLFKEIIQQASKSRPVIQRKLKNLRFEIDKIEYTLKHEQTIVSELKGGRASKMIIVGALIKLFCLLYNRKTLEKHQISLEQLGKQKQVYFSNIEKLKQMLSNQDKIVEAKIKRVDAKLHEFESLKSFSPEELSLLFDLEYQIRDVLPKIDLPNDAFQKLHNERIIPLIRRAKEVIKEHPIHLSIKAADNKGKAAQACFEALKNLTEKQAILKTSVNSAQDVFLFPEQGTVFKHSDKRAREEEWLVNHLYDLMSEQAVVGTFNIQKASIEKFGIEISQDIQERGFTPEEISPTLCAAITKKLSSGDQLILQEHKKAASLRDDQDLINYQQMAKRQWFLKFPRGQWQSMSLKELQNLYLANKLPVEAEIGSSAKQAIPLTKHINEQTNFFRALNYFPTLKASPQNLYLTPNLNDLAAKTAYELCEQFKWSYIDIKGNKKEVDFKTLHALHLQKEPLKQITALPSLNPLISIPTSFEIDLALDVQWKAISPSLMKLDSTGKKISELIDIQVKPFIKPMILMNSLKKRPLAQETILKRLTPDAEFNAVLTGELQLLDAHDKNLGLTPEPTPEYERFKDISFYLSSYALSFEDLIIEYLEGKIQPTTRLQFRENGQLIQKTLKELPDLQKALDVSWRFVIFDTDLSLSEDNHLQEQVANGETGHLIPYRCVLLETKWKDHPLDETTIKRLINSDDRDLRVKNWIKRDDAPIYKMLSKATKDQLIKQLDPLIEQYTLSEPRRQDEDITVKQLKDDFSQKLSNLKDPKNLAFWQMLENELSFIKIRPNDTIKKIAQRHNLSVKQLKALNPNLDFKPGNQIKIKYNLTSNTKESKNRRLRLAAQLFPRLTKKQQNALTERQNRRKNYLHSYQELYQSKLQNNALFVQIKNFLNQSETPFSSARRIELIQQLQNNQYLFLSNPQSLLSFKQAICQECQPTYFNLMKAMYPLLADAYALAEFVHGKRSAGENIGLFTNPLEKMISSAKTKFPSGSAQRILASQLSQQIATIKDPAFFGHWSYKRT